MNYEESRLRTFENWPANAAVDARRIAKAGFYYMGQALEVQCFCCGVRISEWNYGDKVMARHRLLDPGCPFVRNPLQSGNVPMLGEPRRVPQNHGESNGGSRVQPIIPSHVRSGVTSNDRSTFRTEDSRLQSFAHWPIPFIVSPEQLAQSGFFYTECGDKVQCAFCNVLVGGWESGDDPDTEHKRHFRLCPFINNKFSRNLPTATGINMRDSQVDGNKLSLKELGVQNHRVPRNPKYSTYESRLRTYSLWPQALSQKPEELADAGFYFTGRGDQVRCFHCDGGLRLWENSDVPWQEHARWFPDCGFIILIKGQQFIDEAILSRPPVMNPAFTNTRDERQTQSKMSTAQMSRIRIVSEEELQGLMSTPSAVAALQVGIEASRVKQALKHKMEQTGIPFTSPDALIVAALEIQNEENSSQEVDETWTTPPDSPILGWPRVAPRRAQRVSTSEDSDQDDPETGKKKTPEKDTVDNKGLPGGDPSTDTCNSKKLNNKMSLEEENRRLKEARLCKICMDKDVCVVFLPCRHLVTCVQCAPSLTDCPLCRQPIKATVHTFLS